MSTYLHKSAGESETFDLTERHIYGSSRLGLYKEPVSMLAVGGPPAFQYDIPGYRHYELSNHLGNVTTIITGQKLPILSGSTLTGYKPQIVQSMDYSPFGVTRLSFDVTAMSTTDPVGDGYRYGFNGMEKDDEVKGAGNSLDFGARVYDSRLGRWLSLDPLQSKYPGMSAYTFTGNNPVLFVDYDGQDFGIKVNHQTKTIQIVATVYAVESDIERAQAAADKWNSTKGFTYSFVDDNGDNQEYNIEFSITVVESKVVQRAADDDENGVGNSFTVVDDTNPGGKAWFEKNTPSGEKAGGFTRDSKHAFVKGSKGVQTDTHEVGHFMLSGNKTSKDPHVLGKGEVMHASLKLGGMNIGKSTIQNILKGAGIGGLDSPKVDTDSSPIQFVTHENGEKPKEFDAGKVEKVK